MRSQRVHRTRRTAVIVAHPHCRKCEVSAGIDEAGHHHTSGSIDLGRLARLRQVLQAAGGANFYQHAIAYQQRAVGYYTEFLE